MRKRKKAGKNHQESLRPHLKHVPFLFSRKEFLNPKISYFFSESPPSGGSLSSVEEAGDNMDMLEGDNEDEDRDELWMTVK